MHIIKRLSQFHRSCQLIAALPGKRLPLPTKIWLSFLREGSPMISSFITLWISRSMSSRSLGPVSCRCPKGSSLSFPKPRLCKGKAEPSLRLQPATCFVWFSCSKRRWKGHQRRPKVSMGFWIRWTWQPNVWVFVEFVQESFVHLGRRSWCKQRRLQRGGLRFWE